jgi:acetoin utilization protein AcuB
MEVAMQATLSESEAKRTNAKDLVRAVMSQPVIRVAPNTPILEAFNLMYQRDLRHLVVMEGGDIGGKLVGIVTDRDLRRPATHGRLWSLQDMYLLEEKLAVKDVMSRQVITVPPDATVALAARLMLQNKIDALPVVEDGDIVVGIVTSTDLLSALMSQRMP